MTDSIVPPSFRDQPRWWTEGTDWLDSLPDRIGRQCVAWNLEPDGKPWHGSNALVLPVVRDGDPYALRLAPPDERTRGELAALDFWSGRGTVLQYESDQDQGASLLERLDGDTTLQQIDLEQAAEILGTIMRRLAVPIEDQTVPSTGALITERLNELERDWAETGGPFERAVLSQAVAAARSLSTSTT